MSQTEVQLELDLFQQCKFPDGRPSRYPARDGNEPTPCGNPALYERHGCRGPVCRSEHNVKIAKQRDKKR